MLHRVSPGKQETITQEVFSEHIIRGHSNSMEINFALLNHRILPGQLNSFVLCELISNRIPPSPNFLSSTAIQRSYNAFDFFHIHSAHQQCVFKPDTCSLGVVGRDPNSLMYLSVSLASWLVYCCF